MAEAQNSGAPTAAISSRITLESFLKVEISKADEAAKFYKDAFDAVEVSRSCHTAFYSDSSYQGSVSVIFNIRLQIGGCNVTILELLPFNEGDTTVVPDESDEVRNLVTDDVSGLIKKAVKAGATVEKGEDVTMEIDGHSIAKIKDPFGYSWFITSKFI